MHPIGLIFDTSFHYLDHLAPLCSLLRWPLWVCKQEVYEQALTYYPDLEVVQADPFLPTPQVPILTCDTKPLLQAQFPWWGSFRTLWLPHGQSDKGCKNFAFRSLQQEDHLFLYGELLFRQIQSQITHLPSFDWVGNFRFAYFQKHRLFYQKIFSSLLATHQLLSPFFLYAPTWEDWEENSSWNQLEWLISLIPSEIPLVIKPHPNTEKKRASQIERLKGTYPSVRFLDHLPPIYPLLERCSLYIGDASSIGYDFLSFDRPLFFLPPKNRLSPLHRCGTIIRGPLFWEQPPSSSVSRKKLYAETFASCPKWSLFSNNFSQQGSN